MIAGIEVYADYVKEDSNIITILSETGAVRPYGIITAAFGSGSASSNIVDINVLNTVYNHYGIYASSHYSNIDSNIIDMYNNNAKDLGLYITGMYSAGRANVTHRCGTGITDAGTGNDVDGLDA